MSKDIEITLTVHNFAEIYPANHFVFRVLAQSMFRRKVIQTKLWRLRDCLLHLICNFSVASKSLLKTIVMYLVVVYDVEMHKFCYLSINYAELFNQAHKNVANKYSQLFLRDILQWQFLH